MKAEKSIQKLGATPEYMAANKAKLRDLNTHVVERVSSWEARKIPKRGHTFYAEE